MATTRQLNAAIQNTHGSIYVYGPWVGAKDNIRIIRARTRKGQLQGQTYDKWINLPITATYLDGRTGREACI